MSDGPPTGSTRGLRGAVRALGGATLGLLQTRLSLAAVEIDEARDRVVARLVIVLVAVLAFAFAVLGASALVVVAFWETNRIAALCGVVLVYLVIGFVALWRLALRGKNEPTPFAATLAQFERDRAWLAGKPGEPR